MATAVATGGSGGDRGNGDGARDKFPYSWVNFN